MKRWSRFLLVCVVVLCGFAVAPQSAVAHGLIAGGSQVLEVQAGEYPLRIEAVVPTGAPTQLTLKVLPLQALPATAQLTVVAAQRDIAYRSEPYTARLDVGQPLIAVFDIAITAVGNWDLELSYALDRGAGDDPAPHHPGVCGVRSARTHTRGEHSLDPCTVMGAHRERICLCGGVECR